MTETFRHYTVVLKETVDELNIKSGGVYVDCTLGGTGHSEYLLSQLDSRGHLYAFGQDQKTVDHTKLRLASYVEQGMVTFIKASFRELEERLSECVDKVDDILYDLGVSSPWLDGTERGFSYHQDAPLDMRIDQSAPLTACRAINEYSYHKLVKIFLRRDEEEFFKQITREVKRVQKTRPVQTTGEFVEIIKQVIPAPARRKDGHPAKRIFQAVRIAVNDELGAEGTSLEQAVRLLKVNGRIGVIAFHSLEDRIIKSMFKERSTVQDLPPRLSVIPDEFQPKLKVITHKPALPSEGELVENNRSRGTKSRIAEKIRMREEWNDDRIKENVRVRI